MKRSKYRKKKKYYQKNRNYLKKLTQNKSRIFLGKGFIDFSPLRRIYKF